MATKVVSNAEAIEARIDAVEEFDSTFYCIICMSHLPSGQALLNSTSGHIHCYSCWRTYLDLRREQLAEDILLIRQPVCLTCRNSTQLSQVGAIELVGMPKDESESIDKLINDTIALRNANEKLLEESRGLTKQYKDRQHLLLQLQDAYQNTMEQLLAVVGGGEDPMVLDE
ncbi:hypothetical protein FRC10_007968 [Ceratobasidium sp. 414]|nr:hypothetical protein FRC10_007968 [Ceratobasidium sp. 414]